MSDTEHDEMNAHREAQRLSFQECTDAAFSRILQSGEPAVIYGVPYDEDLWSPTHFKRHYGSRECTLEKCNTIPGAKVKTFLTNVKSFFDMYGDSSAKLRKKNGALRLRDFPPEENFDTEFPDLYSDFYNSMPAESYTRYNGIRNLAAHFPKDSLRPDLGMSYSINFRRKESNGTF